MSEEKLRYELALAYQALDRLGWSDLTYTHLSARLPEENYFFISPFGLLFSEVTADNLLKINFHGQILDQEQKQYNPTGYVIHSSIYQHRNDLNAIFHLHTPSGVAVSSWPEGLLPISQWALHFYQRISYHDYNSLALHHSSHEQALINDLGENSVMMLRNHGTISCGKDIAEAFFYTHHLEQACKTQCLLGQQANFALRPSHENCEQAMRDLLSFEDKLGERDWQAIVRWMKNKI